MSKKRKLLILSIFFFLGLSLPVLISAADGAPECPGSVPGGFLTGISPCCYNAGTCDFCDIGKVITNIFKFLRNDIALPLAVLMVIYGGIVMIFSTGSPARVTKGRKILMSAVIGFAIVFGASLIINTTLIAITRSRFTISSVFDGSGISCVNIGNK